MLFLAFSDNSLKWSSPKSLDWDLCFHLQPERIPDGDLPFFLFGKSPFNRLEIDSRISNVAGGENLNSIIASVIGGFFNVGNSSIADPHYINFHAYLNIWRLALILEGLRGEGCFRVSCFGFFRFQGIFIVVDSLDYFIAASFGFAVACACAYSPPQRLERKGAAFYGLRYRPSRDAPADADFLEFF